MSDDNSGSPSPQSSFDTGLTVAGRIAGLAVLALAVLYSLGAAVLAAQLHLANQRSLDVSPLIPLQQVLAHSVALLADHASIGDANLSTTVNIYVQGSPADLEQKLDKVWGE